MRCLILSCIKIIFICYKIFTKRTLVYQNWNKLLNPRFYDYNISLYFTMGPSRFQGPRTIQLRAMLLGTYIRFHISCSINNVIFFYYRYGPNIWFFMSRADPCVIARISRASFCRAYQRQPHSWLVAQITLQKGVG